jgi:N-carbamoyl-L-amino-acid hydrolase
LTTQIQIDQARLLNELSTLATFTDAEPASEGTAVTRIVFSADDLRARAWLKDRARAEGFAIRDDAVGNIFIRWAGTGPDLPAVATGSHTDAIPHAGMYDGTVGVLGGLEAMRALKRSGLQPRRSIELVVFTSEEPTRFGIGCLGSRLLSGTLDPDRADALQDKDEVPLSAVRTAAGFTGPLSSVRLPPNQYHAWIELHIEQGPSLEREGIPIGIVTSIAAPAGYRFTITGFGGHAGALLMPDRKDALCPGAVNSVPSRVVLQLDIRDTDPNRREAAMQAIRRDCEELRQRRSVTITEELVNADAPAQSSLHTVELVEHICKEQGIPYKRMVSRAYHDSLFIARLAPIAMIFIPCRNGVSHRPDEFAKPDDIALGARVLAQTLAKLASE